MYNRGTSEYYIHSRTPALQSFRNSESADIVAAQNTRETFEDILHGPTTVEQIRTSKDEVVTVMEPTAPYGNGVMIAMGREFSPNETITTQTIYDYSQEAQRAFWLSGDTALRTLDTHLREQGINGWAMMTENCISTVSTLKNPTSRSIMIPHAQVFIVDEDQLIPMGEHAEPRENLLLEQKVLSHPRIARRFIERLQATIEASIGKELHAASIRTVQPFGYTFIPSETSDIAEIAETMRIHHEAYTDTMRENQPLLDQYEKRYGKATIPQPSYRLYSYREDDVFKVTVSPEVFSYSGVMEASGIIPRRSQQVPPLPRDEVDHVLSAVRIDLMGVYGDIQNYAAD